MRFQPQFGFLLVCRLLVIAQDSQWDHSQNVWISLAQRLNLSEFCLHSGTNAHDLFASCLWGIPISLKELETNPPILTDRHGPTLDPNLEWGSQVQLLTKNMFAVKIAKVIPADLCLFFKGCTSTCLNVTNHQLECNLTESTPSYAQHTTLSRGWFLFCGLVAYSYVPGNILGGPCAYGRLTTFLTPWKTTTALPCPEHSYTEIEEKCDPSMRLFSTGESTALAASLVGVPALSTINSENIDALACKLTHLMNETSQALGSMLADLHDTEKATIQNRMAIDYLLLKAGHNCAEFKGMCCLNLSDHSASIQRNIKNIQDISRGIISSHGWGDWFGSWFTGLGSTVYTVLTFVLVGILLIFGICLCIQCTPTIIACCASAVPRTPSSRLEQMMMVAKYWAEDPEYSVPVGTVLDGGNEP